MSREPRDLSYKYRVDKADPNNGRCLVQNVPTNFVIEYCHVMPRRYWREKHKELLNSLEWYWNMRNNTLNLDTRRNIFPAGAAFHHMFDTGRFVLTPSKNIVDVYFGSLDIIDLTTDRDMFPCIENTIPANEGRHTFEYKLIPLKNMDNLVFPRIDANNDDPPANDGIHNHWYPFDTLPTLVSHIHPKFAIVSAGLQMAKLNREERQTIWQTNPILLKIWRIYLAWWAPRDEGYENNDSYWPPYEPGNDDSGDNENRGDDPNDPDYEDRTEKGRIGGKKRQMPESPTPNRAGGSSRMRRALDKPMESDHVSQGLKRKKSSNLSHRSVVEHTRKMGKAGWDEDALKKWSRNLIMLSFLSTLWRALYVFEQRPEATLVKFVTELYNGRTLTC